VHLTKVLLELQRELQNLVAAIESLENGSERAAVEALALALG
jgi:hypothetical protein